MRESLELINATCNGIRPRRTPIFDLFANDAVIQHFSERKLDGSDDEIVCNLAIGKGLDATRAMVRPAIEGTTYVDVAGNIMVNSRWTNWVQKPAFSDVTQWANFIKRDIDRLKKSCSINSESNQISDQCSYNKKLNGTVFIHSTPSTAINALLFGYHCGLEHFSYLWADYFELLSEWFSAFHMLEKENLRRTAHPETSPLVIMYSDMAYKNSLMFSKKMLQDIKFFDEVAGLCEICHEKGMKAIFHSDGYIMEILADLVAAGIDGLNPIEKAAGMDIYEIRRMFPELILVGGVDVTGLLRTASPNDIRKETNRILWEVGGQGRLMIGSSTEVDNEVPLESYLAFHNEVLNAG